MNPRILSVRPRPLFLSGATLLLPYTLSTSAGTTSRRRIKPSPGGCLTPWHPEHFLIGASEHDGPLGRGSRTRRHGDAGSSSPARTTGPGRDRRPWSKSSLDGDLMEGVSAEACSLPRFRAASSFLSYYKPDPIDGPPALLRPRTMNASAYGWHVSLRRLHDLTKLRSAIRAPRTRTSARLIIVHSTLLPCADSQDTRRRTAQSSGGEVRATRSALLGPDKHSASGRGR